jgi:hypothetical protein
VCLVLYLAWWALGTLAANLPQPARVIITVIFAIICVLVLLNYVPGLSLPRGRWG